MSRVKLKNAIEGKKTVTVEKKAALYATKCDCCGKVFQMKEYCNDTDLGYLKGTFDSMATGSDGRGLGNGFSANVCSFKCADKLMTGGWKDLKEYKPYVKEKANLVRCELKITSYVIEKKNLISQWDKLPIS